MVNVLARSRSWVAKGSQGAVGAGLVLVLLPSMTLVFFMKHFAAHPTFGYPVLAVFGIMILLGALALVSTLFARLGLSCESEALALPPGSIRATIALSLIVLFALLAVMLHQSLNGSELVIRGLGEAAKQQLVADPANAPVRVTPIACPAARGAEPAASAASASASAAGSAAALPDPCSAGALFKYDVSIGQNASAPGVDFAKQLLTLIGTLMTSVVSFYFAAKSTETVASKAIEGLKAAVAGQGATAQGAAVVPGTAAATGAEAEGDHEHGGVQIPTADTDLPAAQGGVAPTPAAPPPTAPQ